MTLVTLAAAIFLLCTLVMGMFRVVRGPTAADRMLVAQLFGTTGVAILLLLAQAWDAPALNDIALIFALLAAIVGITFVRRYPLPEANEEEEQP
ncbi:MAG: hypothetical protein JJT82_09170 [Legionellaceae bacterium]|nr:hypothetical protein [Legionellaceae bacterium]